MCDLCVICVLFYVKYTLIAIKLLDFITIFANENQ